jgi:hypothetical protein
MNSTIENLNDSPSLDFAVDITGEDVGDEIMVSVFNKHGKEVHRFAKKNPSQNGPVMYNWKDIPSNMPVGTYYIVAKTKNKKTTVVVAFTRE